MRRFEAIGWMLMVAMLAACAPGRPLSTADAEHRLMEAHEEWKGTPYRLGGSTRNGIDCSAFVQVVMRDHFKVELPRSTGEQMRAGRRIRPQHIRTGDLVFFRTGRRTLHVGIVVRGDRFLHASTSSGPMISRLTEDYWRNRFIRAQRVF